MVGMPSRIAVVFITVPFAMGYIPVRSIARYGEHTGQVLSALSKTVPAVAMASKFGVGTILFP
jgi:hypothetical protein